MPVILTFGDSNTHGSRPQTTPGVSSRYGAEDRWPTVMQSALGSDWHLVEEGLPGRTTQYADDVMGGAMDGRVGLNSALRSHGPIDVLTVMLGTNDLKTRLNANADSIVAGLAAMADMIFGAEMRARHPALKTLLICPPMVREIGPFAGEFFGAERRGAALPNTLRDYAAARGVGYLDANTIIEVSDIDGIHFDADAHRALGAGAAEAVRAL